MKIEVKLELKIATALLIAGGEMSSRIGIDKSTVRNKDDDLIIPASTVKGKLRDECQRVLRGLAPEVFVCKPPRAENMCPQPFINGEDNSVEYCVICQMFGSPWKPSPLYFTDLIFPKSKFVQDIRNTTTKIGVAIDRYTRTAKDKSLYYLETSPQGYEIPFESGIAIKGEINNESEAALLYAGIRSLFNIGGSKSIGLGWISGEKIKRFTLTKPDGLCIDFLKFNPSEMVEVKEWLKGFHS